MSKAVLDLLKQRFGDAILETHSQFGDDTAVIDPASWYDVGYFLKHDPRMAMNLFVDLTAVDFPDRDPRFEVVCHLRSIDKGPPHPHQVARRLRGREGRARLARLGLAWSELVRA